MPTACTLLKGAGNQGTELMGQTSASCTGAVWLALALRWTAEHCWLLQEMLTCVMHTGSDPGIYKLNIILLTSGFSSHRRMCPMDLSRKCRTSQELQRKKYVLIQIGISKWYPNRKACVEVILKGGMKSLLNNWVPSQMLTSSLLQVW